MPVVAVAAISAASSIYGASKQAKAAKKAGKVQAAAAAKAAQEARDAEARSKAQLAPYLAADQQAMGAQQGLLGLGDPTAARAAYEQYKASTGYQSRLDEGNRSVERSAAARGGLNSGRTLKELTRFGQNYATNDFNDYYGKLQTVGGVRGGAASQNASTAINTGQSIGNYLTQQGNATANGITQAGNAWASGIQGVGQALGGAITGGAFGGMGGGAATANYLSGTSNPSSFGLPAPVAPYSSMYYGH